MNARSSNFFHLTPRILRSRTWPPQAQALKVRLVITPLSRVLENHLTCTHVVALRRFADYVPLVVDTELVRGVCEELAPVLRRSFRFSDPGAAERYSDFLQEPLEVKNERERLKQRLDRLTRAAEELHDFWAP